jgi:hypothetical protein
MAKPIAFVFASIDVSGPMSDKPCTAVGAMKEIEIIRLKVVPYALEMTIEMVDNADDVLVIQLQSSASIDLPPQKGIPR